MVLKNFNGSNSIYKLTFDYSKLLSSTEKGLNTLYINENHASLYPENKTFQIDYAENECLCNLGEGSCIEINTSGKIQSAFSLTNDNTLYITDKCNSNCIMCPMAEPARKFGHNTPIEVLRELVKYMPENMEHLTITGGEPFMIRGYLFDILKTLKNNNKAYSYLLLTNGRIFSNHEYCQKFSESVPEDFLVGIPLHGHNEEIHDAISQTPGSFIQTTRGIINLLSTKSASVEIRIVINKINAPHMIEIAQLICQKFSGINSVKFMGMEMLGNAIINSEKIWISYKDAFSKIKPAIDFLIKNSIDVAIYNFPLCFVDREYWHICANSIAKHKIKYTEACNQCNEKNSCGGMFTGTDKYLIDHVIPIK